MPNNLDEQIESGEDRSSEQPDPLARYLLIIITSAIVLTIAVVEMWFW